MSKQYEFNWRPNVPQSLLKGELFDRWEDETGILEENVLFRVDEYGFFLYWQPEGKDGQVLELTHVCDIRLGKQPNEQNLLNRLSDKGLTNGWGNIDQRTLIISSGLDLVNISNLVITGSSDKKIKEWLEALQKIVFNHKSKNICPNTSLIKHWMRIKLQLNSEKKIPVRSVTRTFASGKNEKFIFQCLKELRLASVKNESISVENFQLENFIELYHKICPRTDIEELFKEISKGEEYATVNQLIDFCNEYQRDPRLNEIIFPYYDRASILRLINTHEPVQSTKDKGNITFTSLRRTVKEYF
jgi:phosphatidylinositol phospholipase C, beta